MKVRIDYETEYAYAARVGFSTHLFRLFPKQDRFISIRRARFRTNASAAVTYRRDLFDNEIASCFYPAKSARLIARLRLDLELRPRNAFDFLLAEHAWEFPFVYLPEEAAILAPFLGTAPTPALPFWQAADGPQPTVQALVALNSALHTHIAYERRDEGSAYTAEETVRLGRGSCRDYAVLLAAVARAHGVAARLASGYLCEFGDAEKRAEGALHAWTELYLPGAGWVGFDPTNGTLCDERHLTAAVGFGPADISPIAGTFFHPKSIPPARMNAHLTVLPA